ncbi:probable OVARIAN TUMOR DOMAIN-containing deubiquitinating enzyme 4 [Coccomyxa sp. Obi]|nr:probable OVARIAN TUMOR DOMAIN-containing deubiquitinating enzyme 4 [Coccomyxa sp. Obi]
MVQRHTLHLLYVYQRPLSLPSDRRGQLKVSCRASGSAFNSDRIQQVDSSRAPAELGGSAADRSSASSSDGQGSSGSDGAPVQFEIHKIAGDGSCLFRAIAQGAHHVSTGSLLSRRELFEAGFDLRREVCAEMVRRREDIEPFIPGLFDAYVSNMSLEGIWGGEPELAVAIHCIQRPIVVYKEVKSGLLGKDLEKVSEYGAEQYPGVSPVCLLFSGFHYDLLMQVVQ